MVKYTRQSYIFIGDTLKKLPKGKRIIEYQNWDKIFKEDNLRYDSIRFKKYIGL